MKYKFTFIDFVFASMQIVNMLLILTDKVDKGAAYLAIFIIAIGYYVVDRLDKISKK